MKTTQNGHGYKTDMAEVLKLVLQNDQQAKRCAGALALEAGVAGSV